MRTFWVQVLTNRIVNPGPPKVYAIRYDRCVRVVKMASGEYLVRTWRQPFKKKLVGSLLMREAKPPKPFKQKKEKAEIWKPYQNASDRVREEMTKRSTFWGLYNLHRDLGFNPKDSYRDARKMCRQSNEWKKLLQDGSDPRKMNTKRFYERLKKAPKLFE